MTNRDAVERTHAETIEAQLRASLAELKETQARLQMADRMASMGLLAAGVAHEINNPLAFVVANLDFVRQSLGALRTAPPAPSELGARLDAIAFALGEAQEGATRVRSIVLDLKTFSHPDADQRGPVDLCRVIDSAVNLGRSELRGRARVVREFHAIPPVLGNEGRLSQLFLNLLVNAAHAIAARGDAATMDHQIRLIVTPGDGGGVLAEVADTGTGIAPEHMSRLFDPFFTTKPIGVGTGLGLAICHRIVKALGGELTASSVAGAGSSFRVWLPAAPDGAAIEPVESRPVARAADADHGSTDPA